MREKVFNVCAYDTERRRTDDTNRAVLHFQPAANRLQKHRGRVVFYQVAADHRESACMCVKGKDG